jgi:rubrerythrin
MQQHLFDINHQAHHQFLHPNKMPWQHVRAEQELDFIASSLCGHRDDHDKAVAYLYKELAQLAEIEMHVASTLVRVICEASRDQSSQLWAGTELVHTLSCFAAEEIQHANTFYQYVRELSGRDIKTEDNMFTARAALYEGEESPRVKLAALCATAYVGESVITVFEKRMKALDPEVKSPFTLLLHLHGLDEARHIKADHYVIDHIVTGLSRPEIEQMTDLIAKTEHYNVELSKQLSARVKQDLGVDYAEGNYAASVQMDITNGLRNAILAAGTVRRADEHLDSATRELIAEFAMSDRVHAYA